ncbi:hypothetical protein R3I93_008579 [Phoxinus phoxinus]|uniref:C2H2-type domain-containing protein n=1 Tax=Phoxinus phoxinus TaxID=58324 RepID=A0AAN9H6R5_9TELE
MRREILPMSHITIKRRGQEPRPQRCHADTALFTCPFCSTDVCKPRQYHQIMAHIAGHKLRAVEYGDHVIYSCNICCGKMARHFHCCQCPKTYINKAEIKKHLCNSHPLASCTLKPQPVSPPQEEPPFQHPASPPLRLAAPPVNEGRHISVHRHITIKRRGQEPRPQRCHADAALFTCPFCSTDVCKPRQYHQIMAHIAGHKLRAVEYGDHVIYSCNICCGKMARHFHCCQCPKTYINKAEIKKHLCNSHPLASCTLKPQPVSRPLQEPPFQQPASHPQEDSSLPQPASHPQEDSSLPQPASHPQEDSSLPQPASQPQEEPPFQQPASHPEQHFPLQKLESHPQEDPPFQHPASPPLRLAAPPVNEGRHISVQCRRRHITIKRRGQEPRPQRCHADAALFTCPFCSTDVCKPRQYHQIMAHIAGHKLRAVEYGDDVIYSCNSCGEKARHFHCCQCPQSFFNQGALRRHLYSTHPKATGPPEPPPVAHPLQEPAFQTPAPRPLESAAHPVIAQRKQISVQCPHCRVSLNSKNVKTHIKRKHHKATHPITAAWGSSHKVICDMDISKSCVEMAPRSEFLVTQCVSLSSVD